MHQDLHLFPYKIQILQLQTYANKAERRAFAGSISQRIEDYPDFLNFIFSVTRQIYHLSGHMNKENMRLWAQPLEYQYRPLSVEKVTV